MKFSFFSRLLVIFTSKQVVVTVSLIGQVLTLFGSEKVVHSFWGSRNFFTYSFVDVRQMQPFQGNGNMEFCLKKLKGIDHKNIAERSSRKT